MRSQISFRQKRMVALDSGDRKLSKKIIAKILLKKNKFLKNKQTGNLNSKKNKNFPRWQIDIFLLPRPKPIEKCHKTLSFCKVEVTPIFELD